MDATLTLRELVLVLTILTCVNFVYNKLEKYIIVYLIFYATINLEMLQKQKKNTKLIFLANKQMSFLFYRKRTIVSIIL